MSTAPRAFGAYTLLKFLGAGGTGEAWLARPIDPAAGLPSPLVIKRLHEGLGQQDDFVRRFEHEARMAAQVSSPHLPKLLDAGRVDDIFYVAHEYFPGWTIRRIQRDLLEAGELATIPSVIDLAVGLCRGLSALHEAVDPASGAPIGFVHRDITPDNVLLGEDGRAHLLDLGLGTSNLQDWKTATGVVMGSPGYMAPEQVLAEPVSPRTDIYAVGVVLWELLTLESYIERGPMPVLLRRQAEPVFRPPSRLREDIPADLDDICRTALAPRPEDRWPSAAAFETVLQDAFGVRESAVEGEMLSTLVGEMLWGELGQEKTDVTELMTLRAVQTPGGRDEGFLLPTVATERSLGEPAATRVEGPAEPSDTPTPYPLVRPVPETPSPPTSELFGSMRDLSSGDRSGPANVPLSEAMPGAATTSEGQVDARVFAGLTPADPSGLHPPHQTGVRARGGLPFWSVVVLMLLTLVLGITIGALILGTKLVEPAPVAATIAPPAATDPVAADPRAQPSVAPAEPEAVAQDDEPEPAPKQPPRSPRRRPKKAQPAAAAPEAQEAARDLESELAELVARARALLATVSEPSHRRDLEALMASMSREMVAPKPASVARFRRALKRLESSASP